jgi:hypothetical protein
MHDAGDGEDRIVPTVGLALLFGFGTLPFGEYLKQRLSVLSLQLLLHLMHLHQVLNLKIWKMPYGR